mgnify:CR=1 FL=1
MRNIAKLALRLMIFSLAAGVLLAGVNALTEKPIAENLARKQNAGRAAVIGEYDFAPMEFDAQAYPNIAALYEARDGETVVGYVYELSTTGYAGEVLLSLGVSTAGRITGIAVTAHTETKGLGSADEAPFLAQFTGAAAVPETAAGADAMTGATVSSNAVKTAVSCALSHCQDVLRLAASADAPQAEDAAVPLEALLEPRPLDDVRPMASADWTYSHSWVLKKLRRLSRMKMAMLSRWTAAIRCSLRRMERLYQARGMPRAAPGNSSSAI